MMVQKGELYFTMTSATEARVTDTRHLGVLPVERSC